VAGRFIVKDRNGGPKELKRKIKLLGAQAVTVGIHDNPQLARIARWNEHGTKHIVARPAFRQGLDGAASTIGEALERGAGLVLDGLHPKVAFARAGIAGAQAIQKSLTDFSSPENRPSTVRKKGFNDPWIHTRALRSAVDWRITSDLIVRIRDAAEGRER